MSLDYVYLFNEIDKAKKKKYVPWNSPESKKLQEAHAKETKERKESGNVSQPKYVKGKETDSRNKPFKGYTKKPAKTSTNRDSHSLCTIGLKCLKKSGGVFHKNYKLYEFLFMFVHPFERFLANVEKTGWEPRFVSNWPLTEIFFSPISVHFRVHLVIIKRNPLKLKKKNSFSFRTLEKEGKLITGRKNQGSASSFCIFLL